MSSTAKGLKTFSVFHMKKKLFEFHKVEYVDVAIGDKLKFYILFMEINIYMKSTQRECFFKFWWLKNKSDDI